MIRSMTGYGIDHFHINETTITVEIKTVNSRYLDFIPKIPRSFQEVELEIKQMIQHYLIRGRVEVYITISGNQLTKKTLKLDEALLEQYMALMQKIQSDYAPTSPISLEQIIHQEDILVVHETNIDSDAWKAPLMASVENVLQQVQANRASEGKILGEDIAKRIDKIETILHSLEGYAKLVGDEYRERIKERIEQYIEEQIDPTETRLLQEIAILAEKSDITEEITRLKSHLHHAKKLMSASSPIGRKLDFISQEILREMNTIGAKSVNAQVSELVIQLKSENEKIKEQIQNIE
ncbi:MAG TPA: YicC/YloC family endoribonuclease [Pseudogracilibacillus sp.]|nr:YicC/YloC family endoribonuclease [Pseudogracilibacillus sp.]